MPCENTGERRGASRESTPADSPASDCAPRTARKRASVTTAPAQGPVTTPPTMWGQCSSNGHGFSDTQAGLGSLQQRKGKRCQVAF